MTNSRSLKGVPVEDRFWSGLDTTDPEKCWTWTRCVNGSGYGVFSSPTCQYHKVHRFSYELHIGPIPEGLQIDHLCFNRRCCNPAHLEAVTQAENIRRGNSMSARNARKTHCKRGHEFTPENTILKPKGGRACRTCTNMRQREYRVRGGGLIAPGTVGNAEAARILGVHLKTFEGWVNAGLIESVPTGHRFRRYDPAILAIPASAGRATRSPTNEGEVPGG